MHSAQNPEAHINEEPRNDFLDVAIGMAVTTTGFFIIAILFTVISIFMR